jgi:Na+/H+-dicarboxylate symporter
VLIAGAVATSGARVIAALVTFAAIVLVAMALHIVIVLLPALRLGARRPIPDFLRRISDALMLGFSTASSSAALPVSMGAAEQRLGISTQVAAFVLPLGATANKNGSAVYKAVTAVFLMRWYGVPLGISQLVTIVLTATAAAFAGAGVPGSSLVTTLIVLNAVGLGPHAVAGIALVTAIDRPLDMCRTGVNTLGNLIGTAWIARTEGETARSA